MLLTTSVLFASALTVPFDAKTTAAQVRQQTSLPSYLNKGVAVVTGANSGLGLESVKELLTAGCREDRRLLLLGQHLGPLHVQLKPHVQFQPSEVSMGPRRGRRSPALDVGEEKRHVRRRGAKSRQSLR